MLRPMLLALLVIGGLAAPLLAEAVAPESATNRTSPVGMPARLEQIVLPGSELVTKPIESQGPMVLRIVDSFPHGSDFRYDIEYYGLEPGTWNLSDYLERKDGTATDLPRIDIEITTMLPPGQVEPNELRTDQVRGLGGYTLLMVLGALVWIVGLFVIFFACRKKHIDHAAARALKVSLADRLRPVVRQAIAGELSHERLAELEMMLVAFWRKRLKLEDANAAQVIPKLRAHKEAGPLLRQLEAWLHQPDPDKEIDVAALLDPYRNLSPEALDSQDGLSSGLAQS